MTKKKKDLTPLIFSAGIAILTLGFVFLYYADQRAQNIFGFLGPLFIVAGLITIAVSFLF
ncbi:hypothetical protein ACFL4F_02825 [Candidatus Margulisiibacteriota bacterium]